MPAQDLARRIARQRLDKIHRLRRLEPRDTFAGKIDDVRWRRRLARLHRHHRGHVSPVGFCLVVAIVASLRGKDNTGVMRSQRDESGWALAFRKRIADAGDHGIPTLLFGCGVVDQYAGDESPGEITTVVPDQPVA
jgi:hypothetical protein